jgi:hypothetical protein
MNVKKSTKSIKKLQQTDMISLLGATFPGTAEPVLLKEILPGALG